jgi:C4-dicarboxylate transporter, DctM subunit
MSDLAIGCAGISALLVLLGLRVPIGFALTLVSLAGIWAIRGMNATFGVLKSMPYDFAAHWTLSAIPMFLLMGAIVSHAGLTTSLFAAARLWLGRLPGGLAIATNFAGAGFAAACGSSLATAAAMARIAVPEMLRFGYQPALAAGVATAVGTLGALIPPSIMMVLYAVFAEVPVGKMLIAGALPGLLTAVCYAGLILIRCSLNPALAPTIDMSQVTMRDRWRSLVPVWPLPLLIMGVIGGIYSGLVTATEAGALGAFLAGVIALLQGRYEGTFSKSLIEAGKSTAMIFFIAIGASLFTRFLAFTGLPAYLSALAGGWTQDPLVIVLVCSVVYLILGCFLDPLGVMLLTLPVLLPIFKTLSIDPIWMGVILMKYLEIGLLTPPVGLNTFIVKGVVGDAISLGSIFQGVAWFLLAEVVVMALLISFPEITLVLPRLMN